MLDASKKRDQSGSHLNSQWLFLWFLLFSPPIHCFFQIVSMTQFTKPLQQWIKSTLCLFTFSHLSSSFFLSVSLGLAKHLTQSFLGSELSHTTSIFCLEQAMRFLDMFLYTFLKIIDLFLSLFTCLSKHSVDFVHLVSVPLHLSDWVISSFFKQSWSLQQLLIAIQQEVCLFLRKSFHI